MLIEINEKTMNYGNIKYNDIADGEGVRTTLFVSGCTNRCKGCFQPETWDFHYGEPFTPEVEEKIIDSLQSNYIDGLTLLGGEPFELSNQVALLPLLRKVRARCPGKTVWAYTGFVYDRDLIPGGRRHNIHTDELLSLIDILVDGPYMEEQRSLMLQFRGSENQRVIDLPATRACGEVVLWDKLLR